MYKKVLAAAIICGLSTLPAFCNISQKDVIAAQSYYEQADYYSKNSQYSSAISELKKGLRLNPYDNNIRIGLINNHLLRATYYNNKSHEYTKAMNDLRAALFYLKYYGLRLTDESAAKAIRDNESNLIYLYKQTQIATNLKNRYQIAKNLKKDGEFAASAYEFIQASEENSIKEDCYSQTGDLFAILGNQQQAADYYKKALTINRKNATNHLKLAKAYDALGEANLANSEYNYTLSEAENNQQLMLELESIWVKKIGVNPNDAESHTNLGAVYQKLGDYPKALQEYSKAKSLNPKNLTTRFNLGTLYQNQREYSLAITAYDEVLQFNPKDTSARYYKAQCLSELKQFDKAAEEYRKILAIEPNNTEAKNLMLEAMSKIASPEEMLNHYANVAQSGADANTLYNYAYQLHKANKLDEAISHYIKSIQLDPKNPDCYINLAQAYKQKNDFVNASKVIQDGLVQNPNNTELKKYETELKADNAAIKSATGSTLYNEGRYAEAIAQYNAVEPKTADIYINIGSCYQAMNEDKKAVEYYKLAMAKEPNNADIAFYLGQAYVNTEDWANAKSYLTKALMLKPSDNNIKELYNYVVDQQDQIALERALDLYSNGDYINALAVLNNILSQNKNNAFAYYYRGMVYDAQKKYSNALAEYQKSISLSNAIPEAYYSMALDMDYLSRYKEAYANYQKYLSMAQSENEYTQYAKNRMQELKEYANQQN